MIVVVIVIVIATTRMQSVIIAHIVAPQSADAHIAATLDNLERDISDLATSLNVLVGAHMNLVVGASLDGHRTIHARETEPATAVDSALPCPRRLTSAKILRE